MKRIILLCFALGGCASLQNVYNAATGSYVTPQDVYVAANTFDGLELAAKNYDQLPLCSANVSFACRTSAGVKTVGKAVRAGRSARNQLEGYVTANPGKLVPIANYTALTTAINTIQAYVGGGK